MCVCVFVVTTGEQVEGGRKESKLREREGGRERDLVVMVIAMRKRLLDPAW